MRESTSNNCRNRETRQNCTERLNFVHFSEIKKLASEQRNNTVSEQNINPFKINMVFLLRIIYNYHHYYLIQLLVVERQLYITQHYYRYTSKKVLNLYIWKRIYGGLHFDTMDTLRFFYKVVLVRLTKEFYFFP